MTESFADATAVSRRSASSGDGSTVVFDSEIKPGWDIGGNANGGYLLAIAGRAMADTVGKPPLTLTAHYLKPAPAGLCEVEVTTVRSGRRLATATAILRMGDTEILRLLGTFGEQTPGGPMFGIIPPVDLPSYADSAMPPSPTEGPLPAMFERLRIRIRPGDANFRTGHPAGHGEMAGWFAFADEEPDAIALLLAADAFPPAVFNTDLPVAWVPTVELTVHIRGVPAPGPLRCSFRTRFAHDGLLDEEGAIWDSSGALVAQSRQLALMPRQAG
jgi:acyl-CoA thioesterase